MLLSVSLENMGSTSSPPNVYTSAILNVSKIAYDVNLMYSKINDIPIEANYGAIIHKGIRQMYLEIQSMYYQLGGAGPSLPDPGGSINDINYVPPASAFYYLMTGIPIDMMNTDLVLDAHMIFFGIDLNLYA